MAPSLCAFLAEGDDATDMAWSDEVLIMFVWYFCFVVVEWRFSLRTAFSYVIIMGDGSMVSVPESGGIALNLL